MTSVNQHPRPLAADHPLHFAVLMDLAWRAFRRMLDERVGPPVAGMATADGSPLRPSHVRLLSLTPTTGMRVTDLAARVGMTKQALGELVAALQGAGLVEVTVDQRDRRVRLVHPTPAGRDLQRVVESAMAEIERHWEAHAGPERWATFLEVLAELGTTGTSPREQPRPS
jgi:DNA-binding MarR family transcriptional regulator